MARNISTSSLTDQGQQISLRA